MTTVAQPTKMPETLRDHAETFTMRGVPLLSQGNTTVPLKVCESLWVHAKVYCEGGENGLHADMSDDHGFFVLAGRAKFYDKDGVETEVGPLDGILIPHGVLYRFAAVPGENLVMLRMSGAKVGYAATRALNERLAPDGTSIDGNDPRNRPGEGGAKAALPPKESGEYFGL